MSSVVIARVHGGSKRLAARADRPLHDALNELLGSELGRSSWPLTYWSSEVLFSVRARREWVEPDRKPLPF